MKSKIIPMSAIAALVAVGVLAAGCGSAATTRSVVSKAPSAPKTATVIITHAVKGCHNWSVNGNTPAANQTVKLSEGGTLTVTDNDIMPHSLVQSKGPAVTITAGKMAKPGAQSTVSFPSPGVYHLTTKAGEDYKSAKGLETVGADHVLKLKVVVS